MKNGKIILGAAALIVTASSSLAFKVAHRFNTHKIHLQLRDAGNNATKCVTCVHGFFKANGAAIGACTTVALGKIVNPLASFYTKVNPSNVKQCLDQVFGWTSIQ